MELKFYQTLWAAQKPLARTSSKSVTRKRGSCECIATWGRPSHASPLPL